MNTLKHTLDVTSLLGNCLDLFEELMQRKGIVLVKQMEHGHLDVNGDEMSLKPVFGYLILNAIGAMEGEKQKFLTVRVAIDAPWVSVDIEDSRRMDVDESKNEIINSSETAEKGGLGQGLRIVKSIVTNHGGQISVSGREGEGSIITVQLPIIETETNELSIQH